MRHLWSRLAVAMLGLILALPLWAQPPGGICDGPAGASNPHCNGGPPGGGVSVPEIDASEAGIAIALILGALLLIAERCRRA